MIFFKRDKLDNWFWLFDQETAFNLELRVKKSASLKDFMQILSDEMKVILTNTFRGGFYYGFVPLVRTPCHKVWTLNCRFKTLFVYTGKIKFKTYEL